MAGYKPLKITGNQTGLVQEREEFLLPDDAYPILENAFVWRERIKRKQGFELLGRLRRILTLTSIGNISSAGASTQTFSLFSAMGVAATQPNAEFEVGSKTTITIVIGGVINRTLTDTTGDGVLIKNLPGGVITSASINYATGVLTIVFSGAAAASAATISAAYFPGLPVMGLRSRELSNINNEQMVAFDTRYAYIYGSTGFQEFIPGTTWTGTDSDFFWTTNYWVDATNLKIFWETNDSGVTGDPIRYTNGTTWVDFSPQIDATPNYLNQCLAMVPFRGRLVTFNTLEGTNLATSVSYPQRIRWAAIGNPFTTVSAIVTTVNADAWRDDIRGQGGFLDIPTAEDIVSVGFVRDNLVVYCERSTWQLRYTGRSIAPFQIEKINSELGTESTFSAVQFDTSLVGIGDKGVVSCDSYQSKLIDVKIPDLVFLFNNDANGQKRVHGIRDFIQRLAYWIYPYKPDEQTTDIYPNRRLVYNYENDSWAIFTDSLTALGTFQPQNGRRWQDFTTPADSWKNQNYPWISRPSLVPDIIGGNQQGFVEILDQQVTNDASLTITAITGNNTGDPTIITSPNHNLETGTFLNDVLQSGSVISISDIPTGTGFDNLNGGKFGIVRIDANNFELWIYDSNTGVFSTPQSDLPNTYVGGGRISVRDNFRIVSKKFNFLDDGQCIQLGYIDILMDDTEDGAITLKVFNDYNNDTPTNTAPDNVNNDTFFNSIVPTFAEVDRGSDKNWQRVFCPTRASFITIEWTLSNGQLVGTEQENDVQIDAQILWIRPAGRQLPIGV